MSYGPDHFSPAFLEHPGAARLVVCSGSLVNSVESVLNRHLGNKKHIFYIYVRIEQCALDAYTIK
jgi:hypothetical protein